METKKIMTIVLAIAFLAIAIEVTLIRVTSPLMTILITGIALLVASTIASLYIRARGKIAQDQILIVITGIFIGIGAILLIIAAGIYLGPSILEWWRNITLAKTIKFTCLASLAITTISIIMLVATGISPYNKIIYYTFWTLLAAASIMIITGTMWLGHIAFQY